MKLTKTALTKYVSDEMAMRSGTFKAVTGRDIRSAKASEHGSWPHIASESLAVWSQLRDLAGMFNLHIDRSGS